MKCSSNRSTWTKLILASLLLFGLSCQQDRVEPEPVAEDTVLDYFPLEPENEWTYLLEGFRPDEPLQYIQTEKWITSQDLRLLIYDVTPAGEEYTAYKYFEPPNEREIRDIIGTYVTIDYLDLPPDSLILIARDSVDFLRERFIRGGTTRMSTTFGERDCICTITHYNLPNDLRRRYNYLCKGIGTWIMEVEFVNSLPTGTEEVWFIDRKTLMEYALN